MTNTRTLLEKLPQELYDMIYEFFLSMNAGEVYINNRYLPPVLLRLNASIRAASASLYYSRMTFVADDIGCLVAWLKRLHVSHVAMLTSLRLDGSPLRYRNPSEAWRKFNSDAGYALAILVNGLDMRTGRSVFNRLECNAIRPVPGGRMEVVWVPAVVSSADGIRMLDDGGSFEVRTRL